MEKEQYQRACAQLEQLSEEDKHYYQGDDPRARNFSESKDEHHRPQGFWAGEEQPRFGAHRRGPRHTR